MIYPKASKKLKFTSICSDDHGGFLTPSDHCVMEEVWYLNRAISDDVYCLLQVDDIH